MRERTRTAIIWCISRFLNSILLGPLSYLYKCILPSSIRCYSAPISSNRDASSTCCPNVCESLLIFLRRAKYFSSIISSHYQADFEILCNALAALCSFTSLFRCSRFLANFIYSWIGTSFAAVARNTAFGFRHTGIIMICCMVHVGEYYEEPAVINCG